MKVNNPLKIFPITVYSEHELRKTREKLERMGFKINWKQDFSGYAKSDYSTIVHIYENKDEST